MKSKDIFTRLWKVRSQYTNTDTNNQVEHDRERDRFPISMQQVLIERINMETNDEGKWLLRTPFPYVIALTLAAGSTFGYPLVVFIWRRGKAVAVKVCL